MTLPGLDAACRALAGGRAVVVPNPSPMTYGIIGTDPRTVNALKGRPGEQNVAVSLHDAAEWQCVAPSIDVDPATLAKVVALLRDRLSLLVPVRAAVPCPDWIGPAVRDGYLAMFNGWWSPSAPLWDRFPRLYGSSANRTGRPPAATAAEAVADFGADAPVVDGDAHRDPGCEHAASSMVRIDRDGTFVLHRRGAQDAASGLDPDAYARQLNSP